MRIGDVERLTGLSRKTIRLYEEKGLLSVDRAENSYREYDDAIVAKLRMIAVLRRAGIPLMDIQLWQDDVISAEEMLQKQISALKNTADQTAVCIHTVVIAEGQCFHFSIPHNDDLLCVFLQSFGGIP